MTRNRPSTIREDMAAQGRPQPDYVVVEPGMVLDQDHPALAYMDALSKYIFDREAMEFVSRGLFKNIRYIRSKQPLSERTALLVQEYISSVGQIYNDADLFERMRRQDLARAARRRRQEKNRQEPLETAKYLELYGQVHFRPIDVQWRPSRLLCGQIFEEDTGYISPGVRLTVASSRTVTCDDCARLLMMMRRVRVDVVTFPEIEDGEE